MNQLKKKYFQAILFIFISTNLTVNYDFLGLSKQNTERQRAIMTKIVEDEKTRKNKEKDPQMIRSVSKIGRGLKLIMFQKWNCFREVNKFQSDSSHFREFDNKVSFIFGEGITIVNYLIEQFCNQKSNLLSFKSTGI